MTSAEQFPVVILAGGRGSRLREPACRLPGLMVPIRGKPLLEHQLDLCRRHGFLRVLLLVHDERELIQKYFGDGSRHGVTLGYQIERTSRGTAGALRDALPRLTETFLVIHGDTYLDVDLLRLWDAHAATRSDVILFLHPHDRPHDSDLVEVDACDVVTALHPHPRQEGIEARNLVNAALYVMQRRGLDAAIPEHGRADLERDTFPWMLQHDVRMSGYRSPEYIRLVGTPEELDRVEADVDAGLPERLSGREPRRAVFLDRDGTLNTEVDYLTRPEELELLDHAAEAVRRLNHAGYLTVVVTNQSVVARGDVTLVGLERIHARLERLLGLGHAYLDRIYACPHHPDRGYPGGVAEYTVVCGCRKPATGSIDAACRDLGINLSESWFVGDTTSDIETGRRAHVRTVLVRTGHAGQDGRFPLDPDYVVADLAAAVHWILEGHPVMLGRMAPIVAAAAGARLVVIGGLARSGTSAAAQVLREAMSAAGRTAHVIPLDSWLEPMTGRAEATGATPRYDVESMLVTVSQLAGHHDRITLDLPVYDRAQRARLERRRRLSVGAEDLLIVEGAPALLVDRLVQLADVRVHMEMPGAEHVTKLRTDDRWRGTSDAAVNSALAWRATDETASVETAKARTDFIVSAWTAG